MPKNKVAEYVAMKFFYLKLCVDRAHAYVQLPLNLFTNFSIAATFLKVFGLLEHYIILIPIFIFLAFATIIIGHLDIKYQFAHLETSIRNKINPELMHIYECISGGKNGKKPKK